MSAIRITVFFLICSCSVFSQTIQQQLDTLIVQKSYFDASRLFIRSSGSLTSFEGDYYGALIDNAFNRPEESLKKIGHIYSRKSENALTTDQARYLLEIQQANYARTGQYDLAAKSIDQLLEKYADGLDESQYDDYLNSKKIWSALANVSPQKISKSRGLKLNLTADKAGLWNLPVSSGKEINFIFDTGANISTVTQSTAAAMGMKIFPASIDVHSITGSIVKADLGVCPAFTIKNILVENAIFLVFPDSALSFPQIDYQINGILGFPVIEALDEFTISRNGLFEVPESPSKHDTPNLALDFLTPVVEFGTEYFTFDSGATSTILYPKWFKAHEEEVTSESELEEKLSYGGAGGVVERAGYFIIWKQVFDGKPIELKDIMVFSSPLTENEKWFYGNLGQDVIRSFHSYTMNFKSMTVSFH